MDSNKLWTKWDGGKFTAYKTGSLSTAATIDFGTLNMTGLSGVSVYIGYGVGSEAAAIADVQIGKYSGWAVR
jgi:hypothetical protein